MMFCLVWLLKIFLPLLFGVFLFHYNYNSSNILIFFFPSFDYNQTGLHLLLIFNDFDKR